MSMQLRPYQQDAVNAVYDYLRKRDDNPCVVIPTGGGKTPIIATICRDATTLWNGRVLILAHVKELLQQAADKLQMVCPDVPVGVYSAGLGSRDTRQSVIVAGIQSVYKKACELDRFDLILVDEAHLLPPDGEGMYQTFLNDAKIVNPNVRLIGLTATPYRLKSGTLVGPDTLLNAICYEIGVKQLIVQGFLSPLKTRASRHKTDYSNLHLRAGEFVSSEVEELIDNEDNVGPACREIIMQTRDRHSVLIFAISVSHAQHIKESIEALSGQECGLVTGDTPPAQRDLILRRFKGEHIQANLLGDDFPPLKYLVNVNVLTTGFDAPNVDCVVLLRPTASPGLYYQMVGRGFRLHETKGDCLILDFGNNIVRHGPVDAIQVKQAGERGGDGSPPAKECPECNAVIHAAYGICPDCGYVFPAPERDKHDSHASEEGILSGEIVDTDYDVMDVFYNVHAKKDAEEDAPKTMRVDYRVGFNDFKSEWVCPEHSGWARDKFEKWWKMRSNDPVPSTAQEAVDIADDGGLAPTTKITVRKVTGERFDRIIHYELGEKPPAMENREELDAFGDPVTRTTDYGTDDLDDVPF